MKQNDKMVLAGTIMESFPNCAFNVKPDGSEKVILCYLCGKMRQNFIKIGLGDRVQFELAPPYDKGRIIFREKKVVDELEENATPIKKPVHGNHGSHGKKPYRKPTPKSQFLDD